MMRAGPPQPRAPALCSPSGSGSWGLGGHGTTYRTLSKHPSHARVVNAPHSAIPKTVKFGGCAPLCRVLLCAKS